MSVVQTVLTSVDRRGTSGFLVPARPALCCQARSGLLIALVEHAGRIGPDPIRVWMRCAMILYVHVARCSMCQPGQQPGSRNCAGLEMTPG